MISVTLTRHDLASRDACVGALGFFEWLVHEQGRDDDVYFAEWTPLHSLWLAVVRPEWSSWLNARGMIPPLRGADLCGAYLVGADLRGAYLVGADLREADLRGADLRGAVLRGAYYPYGDLPTGWARGTDGRLVRTELKGST